MPPLTALPEHAHILFEDLSRLASADGRHVVATGVRDDGSIILANRGFWGRMVFWVRTHVAGQRDEASIQVNLVLARQLRDARGGLHAIAASERVGIGALPLRNRDLRVVAQTIQRHSPQDPAAALELRDGYEINAELARKIPRGGTSSPASAASALGARSPRAH
jgi:hypothetical protein